MCPFLNKENTNPEPLTVHKVGLQKVVIILKISSTRAELANVVIKIPTKIFIDYTEHQEELLIHIRALSSSVV